MSRPREKDIHDNRHGQSVDDIDEDTYLYTHNKDEGILRGLLTWNPYHMHGKRASRDKNANPPNPYAQNLC